MGILYVVGRIKPLNQLPSALVPDGLAILTLDMPRRSFYRDPSCRIAPLLTGQIGETAWALRLVPVQSTVNRITEESESLANAFEFGGDARIVGDHVKGGSPGHRVVKRIDDPWLLTGVVESLWEQLDLNNLILMEVLVEIGSVGNDIYNLSRFKLVI